MIYWFKICFATPSFRSPSEWPERRSKFNAL